MTGFGVQCDDGPVDPRLGPDGTFQVRPELLRMVAGDSANFEAAAFDAAGRRVDPPPVTWTSSAPNTAAVAQNGSVAALNPGWSVVEASNAPAGVADTGYVAVQIAFSQISLGGGWPHAHACGIATDGQAFCWGANEYGQLGTGDRVSHPAPVPVVGGHRFESISAGRIHTCGITTAGALYCWGAQASEAVPDDNCENFNCRPTPFRVADPIGFEKVSAGAEHMCAIDRDRTLYCWGRGGSKLGPDNIGCPITSPDCPLPVVEGVSALDVAVGEDHTCAVVPGFRVLCWGRNAEGQLGRTTPATCGRSGTLPCSDREPKEVNGVPPLTSIAAGGSLSCGYNLENNLQYCWGLYHTNLERGPGPTPVEIDPDLDFTGIEIAGDFASGEAKICAISTGQRAYCWGGSFADPSNPVPVPGRIAFESVAPGAAETCGIAVSGATYCWDWWYLESNRHPIALNPPGPVPGGLGAEE